jgi:PadR family transcriptional regulator PadR
MEFSMIDKDPRLSHQTLRVLRLFEEQPTVRLAGSDIAKQTGMLSGTIYPIMMRLERAGWLSSQWEKLDPSDACRPRRRLYRLTGLGYNKSRAALAELGVPKGRIVWSS